ncbi:hypothetical protein CDN98_05325 [Roseateles terrae]|nr:hypothetical protein CDN98_05325 [Roseateles terrae]
MRFNNLSLRSKLIGAFGALVFLLLAIALFAWKGLRHSNDLFDEFSQGVTRRAHVASALQHAVEARAIAARNLVLVSRTEDIRTEQQKVEKAHERAQAQLSLLLKLSEASDVSPEGRSKIQEIARVEALYAPVALDIVRLALNGQHEEAVRRMNEQCRPLLAQLEQASEAYADYTERRTEYLMDAADEAIARDLTSFAALVATGLVMAVAACCLILRSVFRALGAEPLELGKAAAQVAMGNLTLLQGESAAPSNSVLASLGRMRSDLSNIVSVVRDSSESIATGTSQIATGNADLSHRTEEQASALQQTAATMEELGTTVRNNADHAIRADEVAQDASRAVSEVGSVFNDVVRTMLEIDAGSKRISDITSTIDSIAFQTNILALNAAVEAARAGEEGRGFAVVASEVRALAQRSAVAAKEIRQLIQGSVAHAEQGSVLVERAGSAMQGAVKAIRDVTVIVGEIRASSREQATGVGQMGSAMSQIDLVTQQNAALVEESAAAAESLRHQANTLVGVVSVFKVA